jgi:hypothetical protein
MDLFGSAVVLPCDTRHDHYSPILCFIHVPCMQVTHISWDFFQPLFDDQRPPMTNLGLGATTALGNLSSWEARMSSTLIFHSAAHFFASSKLCRCTREGTFSDNTLRGGIDCLACCLSWGTSDIFLLALLLDLLPLALVLDLLFFPSFCSVHR